MSDEFSEKATNLIIGYLTKWYSSNQKYVEAKTPFIFNKTMNKEIKTIFTSENRRNDYNILASLLKDFGFKYPVLYKHYSEVTEDDGVKFLDFNIAMNFANCIDGLILIEIDKIKEKKKERYIYPHQKKELV